ncbi:MAG: hypothetical protein HYS17_02595 [Micavibrio aeruginosavorus]|uniref:Uncharacterized protein n=1 Tax=Micavibrio aeruginosavorus TaxID=349221 RepID=A0A7T5UI67_9BACT|nr:MAG: hypothetical protein HYS17_02595 [Micavibrio aeruginosavorus]
MTILLSTSIGALGWIVLKDAWDKDRQQRTVLEGIAKADVTANVCPGVMAAPDMSLTLAPLLPVKDHMTEATAQDWVRSALNKGVRFAFCPLTEGTTSFEIVRDRVGRDLSVLKISTAATDQQQQAAILQFLKEFNASSVGITHNSRVNADARLTGYMPGRLPAGTDLSWGTPKAQPLSLRIPAR